MRKTNKRITITLLILMILCIALTFVGCDSSPQNKLAAHTWVHSHEYHINYSFATDIKTYTLVFNKDGTFEKTIKDKFSERTETGIWSVDDDSLNIQFSNSSYADTYSFMSYSEEELSKSQPDISPYFWYVSDKYLVFDDDVYTAE